MLARTCRCCDVSSWHVGLQLVRGAGGVPERWLRPYNTRGGTGPPGSAALGPKTGVPSGPPNERGSSVAEGLAGGGRQQLQQQQLLQLQQSRQQTAHPLLVDLDPESVQAAILWLFDASVILEDSSFHDFFGPLCKLSLEMVSMQNGTDVGSGVGAGTAGEGTLDAEGDTMPSGSMNATSLVTPCTELFRGG